MTKLTDVGISDVDQKHVVICRPLQPGLPSCSLLWRTEGKRGRKLPRVGDILTAPGLGAVRVERIDAPGSLDLDAHSNVLIVKHG